MVIGLLILIPSGLCTGIFGVGRDLRHGDEFKQRGLRILPEAPMFGGIPLAIGGLLVFAGFKMWKG